MAKPHSKSDDEGLKRKGVVGSDIEEEKAFYKIDGSLLPSQDEDGDISYSQDGHNDSKNLSFLSENNKESPRKLKKRSKSYATDDESDPKMKKKHALHKLKESKTAKPQQGGKKKSKSEDDKASTDTDGHMCEKCYVDRVLFKHEREDDGNGSESEDSLSSWDSECARIYADVASKEVYDPAKVFKILHTKQYQAEKYLEEQKRLETERLIQQEKMLEDLKKSSRSRKVTVSVKDDVTSKQVSYRQSQQKIKEEEKKSERAGSVRSKRTQSMRDLLSVQLNRMDPNIPQIANAPNMDQAPKDKFKIMLLVEEMIKQNNKIYKAEMMKTRQEEEEKHAEEQERRENLKRRIQFIQEKHRQQYLRKLEENEGKQKGPLHEYVWWTDQRKFDRIAEKVENPGNMLEERRKLREKWNIDANFSEFLQRVQDKIRARKRRLRKSASARGKRAKELFTEKSIADREKAFSLFSSRKQKEEMEEMRIEEEKQEKMENSIILKKERKAKQEEEEILKLRSEQFSSHNRREQLSKTEKDRLNMQRGKEALRMLEAKKKQEAEIKQNKLIALQRLEAKTKEQLHKAKKKDFSTLSSMDFDFSDILGKNTTEQKDFLESVAEKGMKVAEKNQPKKNQEDKKGANKGQIKQNQGGSKSIKSGSTAKNTGGSSSKPAGKQGKSQQKDKRNEVKKENKDFGKILDDIGVMHVEEQDQEEDMDMLGEHEQHEIAKQNEIKDIQVAQLIAGTNLKNVKPKGTSSQVAAVEQGEKTKQQKLREETMMEVVVEEESVASSKRVGMGLLPDDFIEKVFQTAEMSDLPREYLQAQERKEDDTDDFRPRPQSYKKFEREIQGELYRKNEKPISAYLAKQLGQNQHSQSKLITQSSVQREKARNNNFNNQSHNPTQHLLSGEIEYKETKWQGVRHVASTLPKPSMISEDARNRKMAEKNKVTIMDSEIPPYDQRKKEAKSKSLKEKYQKEYRDIEKEEQAIRDEKVKKQQQFILRNDIEDNIFEMANKAAFEQYDQAKSNKKKDSITNVVADDADTKDIGLYADQEGTEAYSRALKDLVPEVFKNISKSNFASIIKKQQKDKQESQNKGMEGFDGILSWWSMFQNIFIVVDKRQKGENANPDEEEEN